MRLSEIIKEESDPRLDDLEEDNNDEINRLSPFTIPAKTMIASRAIGPLGARNKIGKVKPEFQKKLKIKDKAVAKQLDENIYNLKIKKWYKIATKNINKRKKYFRHLKEHYISQLSEKFLNPEIEGEILEYLDNYTATNPKYIVEIRSDFGEQTEELQIIIKYFEHNDELTPIRNNVELDIIPFDSIDDINTFTSWLGLVFKTTELDINIDDQT